MRAGSRGVVRPGPSRGLNGLAPRVTSPVLVRENHGLDPAPRPSLAGGQTGAVPASPARGRGKDRSRGPFLLSSAGVRDGNWPPGPPFQRATLAAGALCILPERNKTDPRRA